MKYLYQDIQVFSTYSKIVKYDMIFSNKRQNSKTLLSKHINKDIPANPRE